MNVIVSLDSCSYFFLIYVYDELESRFVKDPLDFLLGR